MTRKRFSEEDILGILRQIELDLAGAGDSTSKWYIKRHCHINCQMTH